MMIASQDVRLESSHKTLEGISTAKISVTKRLESSRKTLEGISTAK